MSFLRAGSVAAVYGRPVRHRGQVMVPAAEVLAIVGFGLGGGEGRGGDTSGGSGSGAGGGGRILARPVAAIVLNRDGVSVRPIVDVTKLVLAALTAGGFALSLWARMRRPPRQP